MSLHTMRGPAEVEPVEWTAPAVDPVGWLVPAPRARAMPSRRTERRRAAGRRRPAPPPPLTTGAAPTGVTCDGGALREGYRMGRWARLALTVTVLAATVVVVLSVMVAPGPARLVDVTVAPGDTLWGIAAAAAPDADPRDVIAEIRRLNDLAGDAVRVGEVLRVPAG